MTWILSSADGTRHKTVAGPSTTSLRDLAAFAEDLLGPGAYVAAIGA